MPRLLVPGLALAAALALSAHGLGLAASGELRVWAVNAGWTLAGIVALGGTLAAALRVERGRVGWAWRLWAAAAGAWLAGALVRDGLTLAGVSTAPSVADGLWWLFALLGIAGLAYRSPSGLAFRLFLLDAMPIVLLATATVAIASGHGVDDHGSHWAFLALYPSLYTLLGLVALNLLVVLGRRLPNMWTLAAGFCAVAAAASAESLQALESSAVQGHWADPLWSIGLLAIAAAGFRRAAAPAAFSRLSPAGRESGLRALPPTVGILALVAMLAFVPERYHATLYWFVFAGVVFLAARFYLVRRESGRIVAELVRSQEALSRERDFTSAVVETQGSLVCVLDRHGRIVRFNRACERTTGYTFAEVRGRRVWDLLLLPEEADAVEAVFDELRAGNFPNEHENHWLTRDGDRRLIAWANTVLLDEEGSVEHVVGTGVDITESAQAEQALRESREHLHLILETAGDAFIETDSSGAITDWNRQAETTFGWPRDEVLGLSLAETIIPPHQREDHEAGVRRFLATGEGPVLGRRVELAALHRDGHEFPVELTAWPVRAKEAVRFDAFVRDISERKAAEAERERLLADERAAHADAERARADLGAQNERLRLFTETASRLTSLDLDELLQTICDGAREAIGCRYAALGVVDSEERGLERFLTSGIDQDTRARIGHTPQGKGLLGALGGSERPLRLEHIRDHPASVGFPAGHPPMDSFLGMPIHCRGETYGRLYLTDKEGGFDAEDEALVTILAAEAGVAIENARLYAESVAQRARLADQNERLLELDRMKDEFVALVSHELRTPLTSILGYLELVLEGDAGEVTEEQRQFLSVVERNSQRLLRLVGDLLLIAQIEAGKLTLQYGVADLAKLARDCVEAARPRADEKGVALVLEAGPVPALSGDRVRLAQLLDNLVSNAIKFTPEGGKVTVGLTREDGRALLAVSDTGIGIPVDEQARLFERFFRTSGATERAIQGTGLGLYISKAIAEAHGGEISLESAENVGTTFLIVLPLESAAAVGRAG